MSTASGRRETARRALRAATYAALVYLAPPLRADAAATAPPREIIGAGAVVPGFGVVGTGGLQLRSVDDRGRVLVHGWISDGHDGLYWLDGSGAVAAWGADGGTVQPIDGYTGVSPNGNLVTIGIDEGDTEVVIANENGARRIVARVGDADGAGSIICSLHGPDDAELAINDAGVVAFMAYSAATSEECQRARDEGFDESAGEKIIYVSSATGLARVARGRDLSPLGYPLGYVRVLAVAGDGRVLFSSYNHPDPFTIFAAKDGVMQPVVRASDFGAAEDPPPWVNPIAVNRNGDVLLAVDEAAGWVLYRTARGLMQRVAAQSDWLETAAVQSYWAAFNDAGDVALAIQLSVSEPNDPATAVFLYPADNGERTVVVDDTASALAPGDIAGVALNGGTVAVMTYGHGLRGYSTPTRIFRGSRGRFTQLAATGDPAPGGGVFATGGVEGPVCLGAGGTLAVAAVAGAGHLGLVCADGRGLHPLMQIGDPAPAGGVFDSVQGCTLAEPGMVHFSAVRRIEDDRGVPQYEAGVYRAGPAGIERLAASGDVTVDGEVFSTVQSPWRPAVNERGDLVVLGGAESSRGLYLRRGGGLELIVADGAGVDPQRSIAASYGDFGMTTSGEVVFNAGLSDGTAAVMSWKAGTLRVVAEPTTLGLDEDDAYGSFYNLQTAGEFALFALSTEPLRYFRYDTASGTVSSLFEERDVRLDGEYLGQVTLLADGDVAIRYTHYTADMYEPKYVLWNSGTPRALLPSEVMLQAEPWAANSNGYVLLRGIQRQQVLLSGPAVEAAGCPTNRRIVPATPPRPTPTPSPTPTWQSLPGGINEDPVELEIPAITGAAGQRVEMQVILHARGNEVAGTQNDITVPAGLAIAVTEGGRPDCAGNPEINKPSTVFAFPGGARDTMRALVLSIYDTEVIADDAVLYTCRLDVAADAAPGTYLLSVSNLGGSDPVGNALTTEAFGGEVIVVAPTEGGRSLGEGGGATGGGGCNVAPGGGPPGLSYLLLLGALLLAARVEGGALRRPSLHTRALPRKRRRAPPSN